MAEEAKINEQQVNNNSEESNEQDGKQEQGQPNIDELLTQLKQTQAEMLRNKNAMDKVMSENKNLKDQLRQRMSADEKVEEAKKEAEQQQKEYVAGLESRLKKIEAERRYTEMGMASDLAKETAEADISGDRDAVLANIKKWTDSLIKAKEAEWLRTRPAPQSGGDDGNVTKEQFDKMTLAQKSELYERDPETYHRLLGR